MQSVFNVTGIVGDYTNKRITIITNFTVDATTVNKSNVKVVDASSGTNVIYKLSTDKKNIIITLKEWPKENSSYQVNITYIKDMLGRDLVSPLTKIIELKADTKLQAKIIKPANNEAVIKQHNLVYFSIQQLNPDGTITIKPNPELDNNDNSDNEEAIVEVESDIKYHFEFASDIAFFDIVKDICLDNTNGYIQLDNGQYYMRARILEGEYIGDWCEPITFLVVTEECEHDSILSEAQKDYLDEILAPVDFFLDEEEEIAIVSRTPNGQTTPEFYIEFNQEIDVDSLPERLIAYRRDL